MPTWFELMQMRAPEIFQRFPNARRFLNLGFQLDPSRHQDGKLAMFSVNQSLLLNLETGDIECEA